MGLFRSRLKWFYSALLGESAKNQWIFSLVLGCHCWISITLFDYCTIDHKIYISTAPCLFHWPDRYGRLVNWQLFSSIFFFFFRKTSYCRTQLILSSPQNRMISHRAGIQVNKRRYANQMRATICKYTKGKKGGEKCAQHQQPTSKTRNRCTGTDSRISTALLLQQKDV